MEEQETIEPEYKEKRKEKEIRIGDNKIKIEIINDEIIFIVTFNLSFYKYEKKFKINEFNELFKDERLKAIDYLDLFMEQALEINEEEKKLILSIRNKTEEIELEEKMLTNEEIIKELISEIKIIKKEKNELENHLYELDNIVNKDKYRNEINLIYSTEEEGECNIFGDKFVKKNNNNIELNINGDKSKLISKYKLK